MVEQVGGEEERKEQLGELARLELAQSRNPDPNARAFTSWPTNGSIGASSSTKPTTIDT